MVLTPLDWTVIGLYFLCNLAIGLYYSRRARGSTSEYFLSGRDAPWWLAGTSMVATTFAVDTPLLVAGLVVKNGIAGNWLWWNMVMSGMMTVFFYARLWRRAGVMTDLEFAELRYSGKPAAFLRGFRAIYLGLPINCIILGWVNFAMIVILRQALGLSQEAAMLVLVVMFAATSFYATISGLWGVLVTDLFQFVLMMAMVILLAVFAVHAVGGIDALVSRVQQLDAVTGQTGSRLDFFSAADSAWMPLITLGTYLAVLWWSTWYPGSEPGGGGYVAQRIFSAKDERHGVLATLWFNVAHYALRPWPWILTALAAMVLYPTLPGAEAGAGYVQTLMDPAVFPRSLRGLMLAAFAAAYMSTVATQLNWGASYIMNDCYRRFLVRGKSERHYVVASQLVTVLLMVTSLVVTNYMKSIEQAWKVLMITGAGTGLVLLLRWYWWRINAWSEVAAMVVAAVVSIFLQFAGPRWSGDEPSEFAYLMLATVSVTTVAWLLVTFLTPPEPRETLVQFYRRVRPAGPGWKPVAANAGPVADPSESLAILFANWLLGCALIYASLFGIGKLLFKQWLAGSLCLAVAFIAAAIISHNLARTNWREPTVEE